MSVDVQVADETDLFQRFVNDQVKYSSEVCQSKWHMYEFLKNQIHRFEVEYETAIKIITEAVGI